MPDFPGTSSAIIDGDFKLIAWHDGRRELFNLRYDIGETRNLAENDSGRAQRMFEQLAKWRWQNIPARYDPRMNPSFDSSKTGALPLASGCVPFTRDAPGCPPVSSP